MDALATVIMPTNVYRIFHDYEETIKAQRTKIADLEQQKENWIRLSGPMPVHAMAYDGIPGATVMTPEPEVIMNIARIDGLLQIEYANMESMQQAFGSIKRQIRDKSKDLNDKELKVFTARFIDGKRILEVAQEVGYSVIDVKRTIRIIREKAFSMVA